MQGGLGRAEVGFQAHPGDNSQATPRKGSFWEKSLVKYCNFIVNIDHSLCHIFDGRSYVNLGFFSLKGNHLLYMREIYYGWLLF